MPARGTGKAAFARMERVSRILALRYSGKSLADIGEAEGVSAQAIHALISRALAAAPPQSTADIRLLEANRLDAMQAALWPACLLGDIAAINAALRVMVRRAQLLGLDLQRPSYGYGEDGESPGTVQIEIVGNPEIARVKWMETEIQRLRQIEAGIVPVEGKPTIN